ncbi:MAG: M12 family metallo-peptidase, partial [Saprospiraceae bacterium]
MPRSPNKTYYGYTSAGNQPVRITADEDFFHALIFQGDEEYYIDPAKNYIAGTPDNQFIIYKASDNVRQFSPEACGVTAEHKIKHHSTTDGEENHGSNNRLLVCKILQIALANDYEMFQEKGSVAAVEAHNMAVINDVLTNYDFEFTIDMEFEVVEIYVASSNSEDPWTNSLDPGALLPNFASWGQNGFSNAHDVGGLWTNRDFTGDVVGLAYVGTICQTGWKYHIMEDFTNNANWLRCLQAHEMGHNFDADHDPIGSTTIMAPTVQNTNTWSTASLNSINSFMN